MDSVPICERKKDIMTDTFVFSPLWSAAGGVLGVLLFGLWLFLRKTTLIRKATVTNTDV